MVKKILPAVIVVVLLSSCSVFKPLNFTSNRQAMAVPAPIVPKSKFIDEISVSAPSIVDKTEVKSAPQLSLAETNSNAAKETATEKTEAKEISQMILTRASNVEAVSPVQLKYAVLLNTEVESLPSKILLENVDEWYGVRYRHAGNTKSGVDCSGFTVAVYSSVYGIMLPRVSREQYRISRKISTTELQEGDLVFFNTNGRGVSHVGVYLGNNRFIHASVSRGVMVNSLFENYYIKRFVGGGRIDNKQVVAAN